MPKTITIDVAKLNEAIKSKGLGTGTAALVCRISNNAMGRIVGRGWGFATEVELLVEHLGTGSFIVERKDEVLSELYMKATINASDDPEAMARVYLAEEVRQSSPRSRIMKWFKDEFAIGPADLRDDEARLSIPKTKEAIEEAEDPRAMAGKFFAEELGYENPRTTLLAWFKEEYGLEEE